jgi:hypothetical protein
MAGVRVETADDAVLLSLRVLRDVGATHLSGRMCPECDNWAFASRRGRGSLCFVCVFCGCDWLAT